MISTQWLPCVVWINRAQLNWVHVPSQIPNPCGFSFSLFEKDYFPNQCWFPPLQLHEKFATILETILISMPMQAHIETSWQVVCDSKWVTWLSVDTTGTSLLVAVSGNIYHIPVIQYSLIKYIIICWRCCTCDIWLMVPICFHNIFMNIFIHYPAYVYRRMESVERPERSGGRECASLVGYHYLRYAANH